MCDCFTIGGPWIAEDPNCPVHGLAAQKKYDDVIDLRSKIKDATSFEDLKKLMLELLDLIEN